MIERAYITVAAVADYQRIMGRPVIRDGEPFEQATRELVDLLAGARLRNHADGPGRADQHQAYVTTPAGRRRVELYVRSEPRPEGPLPQLVKVKIR